MSNVSSLDTSHKPSLAVLVRQSWQLLALASLELNAAANIEETDATDNALCPSRDPVAG